MCLKEALARYANYCKECAKNNETPDPFEIWLTKNQVDVDECDDLYIFSDNEIPSKFINDIGEYFSDYTNEELESDKSFEETINGIMNERKNDGYERE